jgi:hypothetical protein
MKHLFPDCRRLTLAALASGTAAAGRHSLAGENNGKTAQGVIVAS